MGHVLRVLIVSDVRFYREGLERALNIQPRVAVVGVATHSGAPALLTSLDVDVVLLDLLLQDDILASVRAVTRRVPGARVVVLAGPDVEQMIVDCAEAGISGYVTRDHSLDELTTVLERAARGEVICTPRVAGILLHRVSVLARDRRGPDRTSALTSRELEVVGLIGQGLSNKQIARRLSIEVPTVKNHVHSILRKVGAARRGEVASRLGVY